MTAHRERACCYVAVVAMWTFLVVQALHAPTLLGDWSAIAWLRHHSISIGHDPLLLLVQTRWVHVVATPLLELAIVLFAFAIAFARWPRATLGDLRLLIVLQLLIWIVVPGARYFTRPFATTEVWPFAAMLALVVPYRMGSESPRSWLVPIMFVIGGCAGIANEHAAPTAVLALIALMWSASRTSPLRAWMIAGTLGLVLGFVFARGEPTGARSWPLELVGGAQLAIDGVIVALLVALRRGKLATLTAQRSIGVLLAAAIALVATQLVWPVAGSSWFAPAVLIASALTLVLDWVVTDRSLGRVIAIVSVLALGYVAVRFAVATTQRYDESQHRIELLEAGKPNTVVKIPPYTASRWSWGDDFASASLREYVANEVYELNGIGYDRLLAWAEPTPPERFVAIATFDPPVTTDQPQLAQRYIPMSPVDALAQLRHGPLTTIPGHTLVHYTVDVVGSQLDDPAARPVHVFDWTPDALTMVRGRSFEDRAGHTYVQVDPATAPTNTNAAFVVGCGRTRRVKPEPGPLIPIAFDCRGAYTAYLCDPGACWLAGRSWR